MEQPTIVAAAVIRKGGKILIAQRKPDSKLNPNKWEFPGGKIRLMEHPEDCLIREIREELGIEISIDKLLLASSHVHNRGGKEFHILLLAFLADYVSGEVDNIDCQDSKWATLAEMGSYDFSGADLPVIRDLKKLYP